MTGRGAQPVPPGFHAVTPSIVVSDAGKAIECYRRAFGAQARDRFAMPNGKIGHAK
jgi:PhnB protein